VTKFDKVIPPGSVGKIYASVDISHYKGPVQKHVAIKSNDPTRPDLKVFIKARVKSLIDVEPEEQVRFVVNKGSLQTQDVFLVPQPSIKIQKPIVNSDFINATLSPAAGGRQKLTVELKRSNVIGTFATDIKVPLEGPIKEITIPVGITVRGPLQVTPPIVSFQLIRHPEEVVVANTTDIRQAPDPKSPVVEKVNAGRKLEVLSESNGWYQVLTFEETKSSQDEPPLRKIGWLKSSVVKPSRQPEPPRPQQFSILNSSGKPLQILELRSTLPQIKVEQKPLPKKGPQNYDFSVSLQQADSLKQGSMRGEIVVRTDNADQPQIKIPVFVTVT
jgi:Bacterial SH3 domain